MGAPAPAAALSADLPHGQPLSPLGPRSLGPRIGGFGKRALNAVAPLALPEGARAYCLDDTAASPPPAGVTRIGAMSTVGAPPMVCEEGTHEADCAIPIAPGTPPKKLLRSFGYSAASAIVAGSSAADNGTPDGSTPSLDRGLTLRIIPEHGHALPSAECDPFAWTGMVTPPMGTVASLQCEPSLVALRSPLRQRLNFERSSPSLKSAADLRHRSSPLQASASPHGGIAGPSPKGRWMRHPAFDDDAH